MPVGNTMVLKNLLKGLGQTSSPRKDEVVAAKAGSPPAKPTAPQLTYSADGLYTTHNADFMSEPRFKEAYWVGASSGHRICAPENLHIEWRVYVCCWAASHAKRVGGDFVECGVSTGIVSRAVSRYIDFGSYRGMFWLVDTFDGIPLDQASVEEHALAQSKNARHYFDCYADVQAHFAQYGNVRVVKGRVPEALSEVDSEAISYLHIDMNIAEPEVAAMELLWDRLMPGAVVVLDDYGSLAHAAQKVAHDRFAASRSVSILSLPTGQGLLLKA